MAAPRILVLPGIGDSYWVMVKMEAFIEKHLNGERPDVYSWDFDGRPRALEYLERVPFIRAAGYHRQKNTGHVEFQESYMQSKRCIFPGFLGFDYYISVNGWLRNGHSVDEAIPNLATNWYFPLNDTPRERVADMLYKQKFPAGYIVGYFSEHGMFMKWVAEWDHLKCAQYIRAVHDLTGLPILLTGSHWDRPFAQRIEEQIQDEAVCVNLTGKTDADSFYALFRRARGCIGWCGGNTFLATRLRVPTLIHWSVRQFNRPGFFKTCVPPDAFDRWYDYRAVEWHKPEESAERIAYLISTDARPHA